MTSGLFLIGILLLLVLFAYWVPAYRKTRDNHQPPSADDKDILGI